MPEKDLILQAIRQQFYELKLTDYKIIKIYQTSGSFAAKLFHTIDLPIVAADLPEPPPVELPTGCSVAEYLGQVTCLEDLQALRNHPFLTNCCPQCDTTFDSITPSDFSRAWDCPVCGWTDNLRLEVLQRSSQAGSQPTVAGAADTQTEQLKQRLATKLLGQYLIEAKLLTAQQIEIGLADQQQAGIRLGEALVQRGWIQQATIEYLMEKIVLPERDGWTDATYLDSSRHLVRTLMPEPSLAQPSALPGAPILPPIPPEEKQNGSAPLPPINQLSTSESIAHTE